MKPLHLLGFASGIAGNNPDCALGPWFLYYHPEWFQQVGLSVIWQHFMKASSPLKGEKVLSEVVEISQILSKEVLDLIQKRSNFAVIGGDHSCAMGTWSAVAHVHRQAGDIGLLWIDAHMDSHSPNTSETQNLHGMPLASLLGHGVPELCQLLDNEPKLKPHNVCLVGIRSYESGERQLLEQLGVRVYYIEEVHQRGLTVVLQEAYAQITQQTCGFGVSIDMDAIDPSDAPGVGCREVGGFSGQALLDALTSLPRNNPLLGIEIAEYNPLLDIDNKTALLIVKLLKVLANQLREGDS
jgi:arginase